MATLLRVKCSIATRTIGSAEEANMGESFGGLFRGSRERWRVQLSRVVLG